MPITEWNDQELTRKVRRVVSVASKEVAEMTAKTARQNLRNKGKHPWATGKLADDIQVHASKFKDGGYLVTARGRRKDGVPYASQVELGGFVHPYGRKDGPKMAIQKSPFLRPALMANRRRKIKMFENKIR